MNNVVTLDRPPRSASQSAVAALVDLFANRRRARGDAFWLKENAELLQILAALGAGPDVDLGPLKLDPDSLLRELRFFPQYYRMYLSLAVDLRDLGMASSPAAAMADFVLAQDLPAIELSDTHRGEAQLLLMRAGAIRATDPALDARLDRFATNSRAFCLPNRRAAYDLTHIVFHAADYGRRQMSRCPARRSSLIHAGIVAWLEDNLDLLAEVTLALRLSGEEVPQIWAEAVARSAGTVMFEPGMGQGAFDDDYHQYLVLNWALGQSGGAAFRDGVPPLARSISQPARQGAALHELSLALLDLGDSRLPDWSRMRWRIWPKLSEPSRNRLAAAESLPEFEGFFEGFARADGGKP